MGDEAWRKTRCSDAMVGPLLPALNHGTKYAERQGGESGHLDARRTVSAKIKVGLLLLDSCFDVGA
jgi:hypothetical protein